MDTANQPTEIRSEEQDLHVFKAIQDRQPGRIIMFLLLSRLSKVPIKTRIRIYAPWQFSIPLRTGMRQTKSEIFLTLA